MSNSALLATAGGAIPDVQPKTSARVAVASLSLSMLLSSLDTSIANTALPTLTRAFHASFHQAQWVVLAYLLVVTAFIVSVGRLGDVIGRRRLLLAGLALFTAASIACGLAPSLLVLIAARAAQGIGAAVMMALTIALITQIVPKESTGRAMGLLGTMSAIGTATGPSIGGLLVARFNWSSIFLINAPLGIVTLFLAWRSLPADEIRSEARPKFDHAGTLLLVVSLAAYALSMTSGHFGPADVALLLAAVGGGAVFVVWEGRAASPLVRLEMFRRPLLRASLAMSAIVSTVMMTTLVVGPFYLSRALGLDAAIVGITLSAGPLVAAAMGLPAGRLVDRFGARRTTIAALGGLTTGAVALALIPATLGIAGYVLPIVVMTANYAIFQAANNTAVMTNVAADQRGVISALLNLSRNIGLITGTAVMGALFAVASHSSDIMAAPAAAVAGGMRTTFAIAAILIAAALAIAAGANRAGVRREA